MIEEEYYAKKMLAKTDAELFVMVERKSVYQEGAVLAAIKELKNRDKGGEDIEKIKLEIEQEQENIDREKLAADVAEDLNMPVLFTPRFVFFFGILFSVFAGAILMAMNFSRLKNERLVWLSLGAGLGYTILQTILLNSLGLTSGSLGIPVSFLGMYLLENLIWKKEVPQDLKFKQRNIWGAIGVALVIVAPIVYFIVNNADKV